MSFQDSAPYKFLNYYDIVSFSSRTESRRGGARVCVWEREREREGGGGISDFWAIAPVSMRMLGPVWEGVWIKEDDQFESIIYSYQY